MKAAASKIGFLLLMGLPVAAVAQVPDAQYQLEAIIESVIEELGEETDVSLIVEDLEAYARSPLNINTASREQLSGLHLLNDIQIERLLEYREKYGPVLSVFELGTVKELYPELLERMVPFIWFGPPQEQAKTFSEIMNYGRHEVLLRTLGTLQKAAGYKKNGNGEVPFAGDRFRYYSRYRFQSGDDVSAGILAEKDPGEAFFKGSGSNGYDFYSGHVSIKINPFIQNLTAGDFLVRSGQGLVVWQGFSMGKSSYAMSTMKTNQGIRPYTSSDENRFFRGVATSLKAGDTRLGFFVSNKKRDGNIAFSDSLGNYFTSLQSSGYHRTPSEIADKKSVGDFNAGALGHWQSGNLKLGAVVLYTRFDMPFLPSPQLYNRFHFRGTENIALGLDYLFSKGRYQLFGEAAVSKSGGMAAVQGATLYLHDRIQLSTLFRHFDKDYHAMWAAPFSEGSSASNETGIYAGTRILPLKYITLSAFADFFRSDWIKYTTAGPSQGYEIFAQADYKPSSRFHLSLRYKNEEKDQKFRLNEKNVNLPEQVQKSRLNMQLELTKSVILRSRVEHILYKGIETENGIMVFQDVLYSPGAFPVNISARLAWFDTGSYNSRIYAFENDLLYAYSVPAFFGEGIRTYINLKFRFSEKAEAWIKLANTLQHNAESIGTGLNEIAGNHKTELKFQLRLKL